MPFSAYLPVSGLRYLYLVSDSYRFMQIQLALSLYIGGQIQKIKYACMQEHTMHICLCLRYIQIFFFHLARAVTHLARVNSKRTIQCLMALNNGSKKYHISVITS
jgi:hypothetical protein